jgi:hypothetical protein
MPTVILPSSPSSSCASTPTRARYPRQCRQVTSETGTLAKTLDAALAFKEKLPTPKRHKATLRHIIDIILPSSRVVECLIDEHHTGGNGCVLETWEDLLDHVRHSMEQHNMNVDYAAFHLCFRKGAVLEPIRSWRPHLRTRELIFVPRPDPSQQESTMVAEQQLDHPTDMVCPSLAHSLAFLASLPVLAGVINGALTAFTGALATTMISKLDGAVLDRLREHWMQSVDMTDLVRFWNCSYTRSVTQLLTITSLSR